MQDVKFADVEMSLRLKNILHFQKITSLNQLKNKGGISYLRKVRGFGGASEIELISMSPELSTEKIDLKPLSRVQGFRPQKWVAVQLQVDDHKINTAMPMLPKMGEYVSFYVDNQPVVGFVSRIIYEFSEKNTFKNVCIDLQK